jgi:hypothetical protein
MRLLFTLLILFPLAGNAANQLRGTWQSDHEETMRFVKAHSLLEPRQSEFLDGLIGRLRLGFGGATMRYTMPDADITINNKPQHMVGSDDSYQYRVLGRDQDSVAIMLKNDHGRDRIMHIHFVSNDLFWLYSEESDYGLRDLNFREYFRRID